MTDYNARRIADAIRSARLAAGLSFRQLEAQSGVPKSVILRFEQRGTGGSGALAQLARALEISAEDLLLESVRLRSADLPAMLRSEYDLPPEAIKKIQADIESVARAYRENTKQDNERRNK